MGKKKRAPCKMKNKPRVYNDQLSLIPLRIFFDRLMRRAIPPDPFILTLILTVLASPKPARNCQPLQTPRQMAGYWGDSFRKLVPLPRKMTMDFGWRIYLSSHPLR